MFKVPQIDEIVEKSTEITNKTIDFNKVIFAESLKYFNDITDKMFYTYTVSAAEAVNQGTEYAKETISKAKVANLFRTGK